MGLYDKLTGKATIGADLKYVQDYIFDGEEVITSYQFFSDSIVLTT